MEFFAVKFLLSQFYVFKWGVYIDVGSLNKRPKGQVDSGQLISTLRNLKKKPSLMCGQLFDKSEAYLPAIIIDQCRPDLMHRRKK